MAFGIRIGLAVSLATLFGSSPSWAQSLNIDFGTGFGTPSASYAGLGEAGAWNNPVATRDITQSLVGHDGSPSAATLILSAVGPLGTNTSSFVVDGELKSFVGDRMYSTSNDLAIRFSGLIPGVYDVFVVVANHTPGSISGPFPTTVWPDADATKSQVVSGTWNGGFAAGDSHAEFLSLDVASGSLRLDLLKPGDAVIAGIQLVLVPAPTTGVALFGGVGVLFARRQRRED